MRGAANPDRAKRRGGKLAPWPDRHGVKVDIIPKLLGAKFSEAGLAEALLDAGDAGLVESNTWDDTLWGVCRGKRLQTSAARAG